MQKLLFLCMVLAGCYGFNAQDEELSPGASLMFKDVVSQLSNSAKNEIFNLTEFVIAENGSQFHFNVQGNDEFPFTAIVFPVDLNNDGTEEIAIQFGNSFTSGMAGVSYFLMVSNGEGMFVRNFGYPGFLMLTSTGNFGYPDILIGGPGFLPYPLWRWDGGLYVFHEKVEREIADSRNPIMISEASRTYLEGK